MSIENLNQQESNIEKEEGSQKELNEKVLEDIIQEIKDKKYKKIEDLPEEYQKHFVKYPSKLSEEGFVRKEVLEHDLEIIRKTEMANILLDRKIKGSSTPDPINPIEVIQGEALNDEEGWRGKEKDKLIANLDTKNLEGNILLYKKSSNNIKNDLEVILKILHTYQGDKQEETIKIRKAFLETDVPSTISKDVFDIMGKY